MQSDQTRTQAAEGAAKNGEKLLLGIDTCGPTGSVALGRMVGEGSKLLEQIELEGRSYSATLVAAVGQLLARAGAGVRELDAIVAVNGPGSFTGVRVGLSAVKGLAEAGSIAVIAVSRLEVLAWKAGVGSSALDAHRHEVFLRLGWAEDMPRELVAGADELLAMQLGSGKIAVCDDAAALLLTSVWPNAELVRTAAPTAADALALCLPRVMAGEFVDMALMDGHYLRRSDAEIFGEAARVQGA